MPMVKSSEQKSSVNSKSEIDTLRYSVFAYCGASKVLLAKFNSSIIAIELISYFVDNSESRTTYHLIDDITGKELCHAYLDDNNDPIVEV